MKWLLLFICFSLIGVWLEAVYQEFLEGSGVELIIWLQSFGSHWIDIIFELLEFVTGVMFLHASSILLMSNKPEVGLLGVYSGLFALSVAGLFKMIFHHPRPFWKSETIHVISCSYDWGSPSGHAAVGGGCMMILAHFWLQNREKTNQKILVLALCSFLTALDRLYLGVHFYFQVVLGYLFGITTGLYFLQEYFLYKFFDLRNNKSFVLRELGRVTIFSFVAVGVYVFQEYQMEGDWEKNYLKKCGKELNGNVAMAKDLAEALYVWIAIGSLAGFYSQKSKERPNFNWKVLIVGTIFSGGVFGFISIFDKVFLVKVSGGLKFVGIVATRIILGFVWGRYGNQVAVRTLGEDLKAKSS